MYSMKVEKPLSKMFFFKPNRMSPLLVPLRFVLCAFYIWNSHASPSLMLDWRIQRKELQTTLQRRISPGLGQGIGKAASLSCWKIKSYPSWGFLAETDRFLFRVYWYFMESVMSCVLKRLSGPLEENKLHNVTDPPPYLTVRIQVFSV